MSEFRAWELPNAEIDRIGRELFRRMCRRWPRLFGTLKPLKLGLRQDLIAAHVAERDVDAFLTWYVRQPDYLAAQAQPGAQRYDLNGHPCGPVSEDNARYAAARLDALRYARFRRALVGDAQIGTETDEMGA